MKVSVAMATFNGGPYLTAQLDSILHQDRLPDELVISDDGSCDETEFLVKEFAATAPFPVIWLRNPGRRGYQRNFDFAISATIGDVVLLADQDDIWLEHHVRRLVAPFEVDTRLMITAADTRLMDASGALAVDTLRAAEGITLARMQATNRVRGVAQFRQVLHGHSVSGHSMALRRAVIEVASPLPSSWMPDDWIFMIGAAMGRVLYVDSEVSRFRRYARFVLGQEYCRLIEQISDGSQGRDEAARWHNLLARLKCAGPILPDADQIVADVSTKMRMITFRDTVRDKRAPVRAIRVLPWLLSGRYHRVGSGFRTCARDVVGGVGGG